MDPPEGACRAGDRRRRRGRSGRSRSASQRFPASLPLLLLGREVLRYNGRADEVPATLDRIERLIRAFPAAVRHRRGPRRARPLLPGSAASTPSRSSTSSSTWRSTATPTSSTPTSPPPSWPSTSRTTPSPPRPWRGPPRRRRTTPAITPCSPSPSPRATAPGRPRRSRPPWRSTPTTPTALLLRADHLIDAERYDEAAAVLDRVLGVNPREQRAWAFRAVIAHLRNDPDGEAAGPTRRPSNAGPRTPRSTTRSAASSPRSTASPRARPTSARPSNSTPTTCRRRSSSARTCCGSATRRRAGPWPTASSTATPTTSSPTTSSPSATSWTATGPSRATAFLVRMEPTEAALYGDRVLGLLGEGPRRP